MRISERLIPWAGIRVEHAGPVIAMSLAFADVRAAYPIPFFVLIVGSLN